MFSMTYTPKPSALAAPRSGVVFATGNDRDSSDAWEGMVALTLDDSSIWEYTGTGWNGITEGLPFYWVGEVATATVMASSAFENGWVYDEVGV